MSRTSRMTKVQTALAVLGVLVIGWLLATPSATAFYTTPGPDGPDLDIVCASVLSAPARPIGDPQDREQYQDGNVVRERPARDSRTPLACGELRTRMVGWSVLVAIPTAVLAALAAVRRREEAAGATIGHDEAVRIAG